MRVIGQLGLKHYSGRINEEFHPALRGLKAAKVYREMTDNDAIVGGMLFGIEALIRQVPWKSKAAGDSDAQKAEAEFLDSIMTDMVCDWENFLSEVLSFLPFGFAPFEKIFKRRLGPDAPIPSRFNDGRIGIHNIAIRAQDTIDRWEISGDGEILGLWQNLEFPARGTVFIPSEKLILFRTKVHKNNPEGRSILRNAYRAWYFKKRMEEIEAIGVERNIAGLPVLQVPGRLLEVGNTNPDDIAQLADLQSMIQEIRVDERMGVIIPSEMDDQDKPTGYKLTLLSASGKADGITDVIVKRYETRISITVLADFIFNALDRVGAQSSYKGKINMFGLALEAWLDTIQETINRNLVDQLYDYNGVPIENRAYYEHGDISQVDLPELATFLAPLGAAGFISPTPMLENELLRRASLPLPEESSPELGYGSGGDGEMDPNAEIGAHPLPGQQRDRDSAWTGIQTNALKEIVGDVAKGELPLESAVGIIVAAFPLTEEQARAILAPAEKFEPRSVTVADEAANAQQEAAKIAAKNPAPMMKPGEMKGPPGTPGVKAPPGTKRKPSGLGKPDGGGEE